jgi:hypothetical protein
MSAEIESLISELLAKCYYQKKRNQGVRTPADEIEEFP